jgi:hypothetical protein
MKMFIFCIFLLPAILVAQGNSTINDVFGHEINLDDIIIKFAGENGIPPQMIKGHIDKETQFKNAYRYEPFEDISIQNDIDRKNNFMTKKNGTLLPFVVSEAGMGGDFPVGHDNVSPTPYEKTPQKITQFLEDHLERYVDRNKLLVIGKQDYTKELTRDLKRLYKECKDLGLKGKAAANYAIEIMKNRFHWKEYGDNYNNLYAQTRISASYGLTQMLYSTAVSSSFEETGSRYGSPHSKYMKRSDSALPPEKLNEIDYLFPRYVDLMLQRLRKVLGKPITIPDHEWNGGFEKTWINAFQKHNPGEKEYGKKVLDISKNYLPQQ